MAPSLRSLIARLSASPAVVPTHVSDVKSLVPEGPKRLLAPIPENTKASSSSLLPRGAYGPNATFFSWDGGRTSVAIDGSEGGLTVMAFVAYWHCAIRWRAQKIAEAPLMVVEEDQDTGAHEWLADHDLVPILEEPSPDYSMGELLEITSQYLDNTGACIWVLDKDGLDTVIRMTPFSRHEFDVQSDGTRMFSSFRVQTSKGPVDFPADRVVYFRDMQISGGLSWAQGHGRSKLDTAAAWLKLSVKSVQIIRDLLENSVWPSGVFVPHHEWNPDDDEYNLFKQELQDYAKGGNKGKPFVALGGGNFTQLQAAIKDLVPEDILNRVESVVAAVSGVPAIVLQFLVGLQNSPWSQMAEARRMAYDDTIIPAWRKLERPLTQQILRPIDEDPTHFISFDTSKVASLQEDELEAAQIAQMWGKQASLNERRMRMGLEPVDPADDPEGKADEIPELTQPSLQEILAAGGSAPGALGNAQDAGVDEGADDEADPKDEAAQAAAEDKKTERFVLERKLRAPRLQDALREESLTVWEVTTARLLKQDAKRLSQIVNELLLEPEQKASSRGKARVMEAVTGYLKTESKQRWARSTTPLMVQAAERSTAVIAADLNVSYSLLHPNLIKFADRQTGRLIKGVSNTTRDLVSNIIQGGLDEGASTATIARTLSEATGFKSARAQLIARTETTAAYNGAPQESLSLLGQDTGRVFTKTWSGSLDDRERDEHVAMEGETVPIDETFSNGLMYPSEPNCRCTTIFSEVED